MRQPLQTHVPCFFPFILSHSGIFLFPRQWLLPMCNALGGFEYYYFTWLCENVNNFHLVTCSSVCYYLSFLITLVLDATLMYWFELFVLVELTCTYLSLQPDNDLNLAFSLPDSGLWNNFVFCSNQVLYVKPKFLNLPEFQCEECFVK